MFGLFKSTQTHPAASDPLDQQLLNFSNEDAFSVRDSFEGVQIFGGIGSGKTSGSGALLAESFLRAGYGGVVLTAKADETDLWRRYAQHTGRADDLIFFGPTHQARFNVLNYEFTRKGEGAGLTENLVALFDTLSQVASRNHGGKGGENEAFWRNEQTKLVRNAVDALRLAGIPITFQSIYRLIMSAPTTPDLLDDAHWVRDSFCFRVMRRATRRIEVKRRSSNEWCDLQLCTEFWGNEFPNQPDKTRSTVLSTFTGVSDVFLRGAIRQLFSTTTNLTPEDTFEGKIIILDLPQKLYNEVGVYAQILFKYCWQRAVERRRIIPASRPLFLWIDESQHFVNRYDVSFQTTSRSSRVATVFLTQNLPNYFLAMGGESASKAMVDSLMGNLSTKIFHNNTCATTNQYAADLISREWCSVSSSSYSNNDGKISSSQSVSAQLNHTVLPREFSGLAKGGLPHDFLVEAIIHQGGKVFGCSSSNHLKTAFRQNPH